MVVEIATPHRAASPSVPSLTKREASPRAGQPFHGKVPRCNTSRRRNRAVRRSRNRRSRSWDIRRPYHASFSFPSGGALIRPASPSCPASAWPFAAVPARPPLTAPASSPRPLHGFFAAASGARSPDSSPASANPKPSHSVPWEDGAV